MADVLGWTYFNILVHPGRCGEAIHAGSHPPDATKPGDRSSIRACYLD